MRYLDPKNDLVFKKVFGEHVNILKSFLNALLPLDEGQYIKHIEYLPPELVPEIPIIKNSIVDVRCQDNQGRQFIVEMQMLWTDSFKSRVLFNASKAYVRQLDKGIEYKGIQPVYALSLINQIFEHDSPQFYHHYKLVHTENSSKTIEGLQLIFVELPKFNTHTYELKKLKVLWLRYLSEIKNGTEMIDEKLLEEFNSIPELAEALELTKESGYTKAELETYDKYWDAISTERTLIADAREEGLLEGREEGREEGKIEGKHEERIDIVIKLFDSQQPISFIATITSLSEYEIEKILKDNGKI